MRTFRLLAAHGRIHFLQWMGGRSFLLGALANEAIPPLIGLAVWMTVSGGDTTILSYYLFLIVVRILSSSYENYEFAERIYEGFLVDDLLRPHAVVLTSVANNTAQRLWYALFGLPIIAPAIAVLPVEVGPTVLAAVPALLLAMVDGYLFTYVIALLAFWTQRVFALDNFTNVLTFLLGGAAAPVMLFPESVRPIVEALPFRSMLGFPAEVAAGVLDPRQVLSGLGWQLGWLVAFLSASVVLWRAGVRRYTAVGA